MNVPNANVLLAGALVFTCGLPASHGQSIYRSGVEIVSFGVTVVDRRGRYITDLKAEDFDVREDGRKQAIAYLATGEDASPAGPLHLGLLFDTSGSMEEDLQFSRRAAVRFLAAPTQAADVTLVAFDTDVRVARFDRADFARLVERIQRRAAGGYTALYDALGVYLDGAAGQAGRKILVVYSDGGDTSSAQTFGEALTLLRASDVTVYSVGFMPRAPARAGTGDESRLRQIAEVTGGQAFFPSVMKDLDAAYEKVLADMRAQYSLGYISTNPARDGRWRRVHITVRRPGLDRVTVRAREGYFAPHGNPPR